VVTVHVRGPICNTTAILDNIWAVVLKICCISKSGYDYLIIIGII